MIEKCPVCRAQLKEETRCYRCRADLGTLFNVEKAAAQALETAVACYHHQDYPGMLHYAKKGYFLKKTDQSARVYACASLLNGKFEQAFCQMSDGSGQWSDARCLMPGV